MVRTGFIRWLVTGILALSLLGVAGAVSRGLSANPQKVNRDAQILKGFNERIQAYVKLHKRMEAGLPPLKGKADPVRITEHQKALAQALRAARPDAKPGDIFYSDVKPYFLRTVRGELQGRGTAPARAAIMEDSPKKVALRVNDSYPQAAPLSTIPPSVLLKLPKLPREVEYRFIDRHLILRDTKANMIVDFILEAMP